MKPHRTLPVDADTTDINISPLIDMVFILLIFFIVTTVFVEETGVEVQRPEAAAATDLDQQSILIAITASGDVVYGGEEIGISGVRPTLRRLLRDESRPVILLVDDDASAGTVVRVIDQANLGGAENISIAADRP